MKKALVCALTAFVFGLGAEVFAQEQKDTTPYPMVIPIQKILAHSDGYRIIYKKGSVELRDVYVPMTWFVAGGKAELVKGRGSEYPYMVVYYVEGKFHHVKLFVPADVNDDRWGVFPQSSAAAEKFKGVEDMKIEY